jgi:hypothetical protein
MKRVWIVLSLILVLAALAVPALANADDEPGFTPAGWTWDESAVANTDGDSGSTPDGWTWDES